MVVTIDIKNTNLSRVSIFSAASAGGGGGGAGAASKGGGNGGGVLEDMDGFIKLTYTQRIYGFLACLGVGALIVGLSYISITTGNIRMFAVLFSVGNIIALLSTMFLMGPWTQIKRMFDPVRVIATIIYLTSIALAIYFGYFRKNLVLALIFGVIELLAFFWYSISYIPYARDMVLKCFGLC